MEAQEVRRIEKFAAGLRLRVLRQLMELGFGHAGGSLSVADLIAVLYNGAMKIDPENPKMEQRDRLVVSKGHAGPALYAALSMKGYFPEEWLLTLNKGGTNLPSHCDSHKTPGIDYVTGSLGQGLSLAIGSAYAFKLDGKENYIYAILGDGECQEGQIWEAAMAGPKYGLDNLIAFVDYNRYQLDGSIEELMPLKSMSEKFAAFRWDTADVDGHDVAAIAAAIENAKAVKGKPTMIILHTTKGKGCSELEALKNKSHHMQIGPELGQRCMAEIQAQLDALSN